MSFDFDKDEDVEFVLRLPAMKVALIDMTPETSHVHGKKWQLLISNYDDEPAGYVLSNDDVRVLGHVLTNAATNG